MTFDRQEFPKNTEPSLRVELPIAVWQTITKFIVKNNADTFCWKVRQTVHWWMICLCPTIAEALALKTYILYNALDIESANILNV